MAKKAYRSLIGHIGGTRLFFFIFAAALLSFLSVLSSCGLFDGDDYGERPFDETELAELDLSMSFSLKTINNSPRLHINISMVMPRDNLVLVLPDNFLRKENLYRRIEKMTVSHGAKLQPYPRSGRENILLLSHKKGQPVTISYYFRPNDPLGGDERESFSAPIIRNDYFQMVGLMAFVYPYALITKEDFSLKLTWDLPSDFAIFNSFGAYHNEQVITTDFERLRDAFFLAGKDLRVYTVNVRNRPVYMTFQGHWQHISDSEFITLVTQLLEKLRETWNDDDFTYFLVHFMSSNFPCHGNVKFAGTAHTNSFRAILPDCPFQPEMKQLISHELMHAWIGKKIKVGQERQHIDGKWFTEGFTDYYGRIIPTRAGIFTKAQYFSTLNRQFEKYYLSKERWVTLKSLVDRMYKGGYSTPELEEKPYQQGELMAIRLNKKIKEVTNFKYSLDDVIRDLLKEAKENGGTKKFTVSEIAAAVDVYAPGAFESEMAKIVNGEVFMPPVLDGCVEPREAVQLRSNRNNTGKHEAIYYYSANGFKCAPWIN